MAEKEGFEPSHAVTRLLAFQASPFSHLGISPCSGNYSNLMVACRYFLMFFLILVNFEFCFLAKEEEN